MRNAIVAGVVVLVLAMAIFFLPDLKTLFNPADRTAQAEVERAQAACLASIKEARSAKVDGHVEPGASPGASAEVSSGNDVRRGAPADLPAELQAAENEKLRACIKDRLDHARQP